MKKVALVTLVFILLAATAIPVLAGKGGNNGQGHATGVTEKTGNGNGGDKDKNKDKENNGNSNHSNAQGNKPEQNTKLMSTPFYLQGSITAIDTGAHTLTVNVVHANAKAKSYIGSSLTVVVTDTTQIFEITQGEGISGTVDVSSSSDDSEESESADEAGSNRVSITLDQLDIGERVAIHGVLVDAAYTARLITGYIGHPFNQDGAGSITPPGAPPITEPITDKP